MPNTDKHSGSHNKLNLRWPFPAVRRVGSTIFVGLQVLTPDAKDSQDAGIMSQTHHVFQSLEEALRKEGASMRELCKLHTYYMFNGDGRAVTDYWEHMTSARLDHLADPGPAATALRVKGLWYGGTLIGADGIGELSADRDRIMPKHAWDWSIPTPFSQGWRVGDKVYVGGQISADRAGRSVAPGRASEQAVNTLEYIRHVLLDAKADWSNVTLIKIAHKWTQDEQQSRLVVKQILHEVEKVFPDERPTLVTLGVDLLYEGLMLEIDATAVKGVSTPVWVPGSEKWNKEATGFPPAKRVNDEIYLGGLSATDHEGLQPQLTETLRRATDVLHAAHASVKDLVKLNVYYCDAPGQTIEGTEIQSIIDELDRFLVAGRTVVSLVRVAGFLLTGQRIQVDGLAMVQTS